MPIERDDPAQLRDELGDLLFQVVFHARMAEERGWFDFAAVARRHPREAGAAPSARVCRRRGRARGRWCASGRQQKAQERAAAAAASRALARCWPDVPRALPALMRAAKLGRRAARVGFDWPEARAVRAKVLEELQRGGCEAHGGRRAPRRSCEELGDLLFAVANWSRHLHVDARARCARANAKFERRFARMERLARERGLTSRSCRRANGTRCGRRRN